MARDIAAASRGWRSVTWNVLKTSLGVDLRSLALMRVGLGLLIIVDLVDRSRDLRAHYTDLGLLPRGPLLTRFMNELAVCIHTCTGTAVGMAVVFALQAVVGGMLLVGLRTRIVSVLAWFLMYSLHLRNPMVLQGGDDLLRMLLFWGMFLPMGARYSVDAALSKEYLTDTRVSAPKTEQQFFSAATVALIGQVVLMYWSTALLKTGQEWRSEGSAVYYALHFDQLALAPAVWLRQFYPVTVFLTFATLLWEGFGPFLLLVPYGPVRALAALGFVVMHHCFALCLILGLFPWIDTVSMLPFLPAWVWMHAERWVPVARQRAVTLYYDHDCGVCRKLAVIVREFLLLSHVPVCAAQTNAEILSTMTAEGSWVVVDEAGKHVGWQGFVALCRVSPVLRWCVPLLASGVGVRLGERAYRAVARRRGQLSDVSARWFPWRPAPSQVGWLNQVLAAGLFILITNWNAAGWPGTWWLFPDVLRPVAYMLRIDQDWGMFAPFPQKEDGWYVIPGKLNDGTIVDVFAHSHTPPSFDKPALVSDQFKNQRWSKYMMNIWLARNAEHRLYFGQYLCRSFNGTSPVKTPKSLVEFEIFFMKEMTLPNYQVSKPERVSVWKHYCYEVPKT